MGPVLQSRAPASGELLGEVRVATREEVFATVARARKAQAAWGILPVEERCRRLLRMRDALLEHAEELVDVVSRECGKPRQEALAHEIAVTVDMLGYGCKVAPRVLAPRDVEQHLLVHKKATVHYVPRGVIGVIAPWNFPLLTPMASAFAALVAGNAVVVKPSELTPLVLRKVKEIFDGTGLPEDLLGVVFGGGETGAALVDAGVQKVIFTGSVEVGRNVAAACGRNLVPCVLELGGKAPLIAASDCDVERTAQSIVFGAFANAGQACISVERVYAHDAVHDALLARVTALVGELRQGDPADGGTTVDVGAMTLARQIDVVERHIADAVSKGGRVVAGGRRPSGAGLFFPPTVLAGCDHGMAVMREESFGPVVAFMRVASEDEAVRLANDSHLGLEAYVFSRDRDKGMRLARRLDAGAVLVNDVLVNYASAETPFGGTKQSGFGRVHGDDALRDMCETRAIMTSRIGEPDGFALRFPYSTKAYKWQLRALRALFTRGGIVKRLGKLL